MAGSTYCMSCGAPLTPGSQFCASCGTAVPGASPPLTASAGAGPSSSGYAAPPTYYGSPSSPPPRRRSRLLIIAVVVVVVLLVIGVIGYVFLTSTPSSPIQVDNINIWAPDNVCGLNVNGIYFSGFNASTGSSQALDFEMPNYNSTNCTVRTLVTNTSGFEIPSIQPGLPFMIPGSPSSDPGSVSISLNITFKCPSSDFSGNLNLVLG